MPSQSAKIPGAGRSLLLGSRLRPDDPSSAVMQWGLVMKLRCTLHIMTIYNDISTRKSYNFATLEYIEICYTIE